MRAVLLDYGKPHDGDVVELKPEERPVGEHDFGRHRWRMDGPVVLICNLCQARSDDRDAPLRCPSRMERRWVTPWEPVG